jgi:peptide/nickel transport system permease protein
MNESASCRAVPAPRGLAAALGLSCRRGRWLWAMGVSIAVFAAVPLTAWLMGTAGLDPDLAVRNQPPSWGRLFGTDPLGRDMISRTMHGLVLSLQVGLLASAVSSVVALFLGVASATLGRTADAVVSWLVDIFMTVPHMVLLILISFVAGGGSRGVVIAVAATHWPALTRIIRAEVLQLRGALYVRTARRFGRGPLAVAACHMLPHLLPQFLIGLILLFPHAILHEAGLTFLGVGLSPHTPAVGILLAESMRHLSTGQWWLGILPGAALLALVKCCDIRGTNLDRLLDPKTAQE